MRCSTVARQVCASALRGSTSVVASTSRPVLRAAVRPAAGRRVAARSISTIPHPELDPSNGKQHFVIRSFKPIPSMAHAFAMMRAVEQRLGPVVSVDLPKDDDTLRPQNTIFITLLRPTKFEEPIVMEIPSPVLSRTSTFVGGIAFNDIDGVLHQHASSTDASRGASGQTLQFNVELRTTDPRPPRSTLKRVEPTLNEQKEDDEIVRALENFNGGWNGGFAGVADQFQALKIERPEPVVEVVEEVVEEVAAPVVEKPVAEVKAPESVEKKVEAPKQPARPTMTRAERMRQQALQAARAAAEHQKKAQEAAAAAAAEAEAKAAAEEAKAASSPKDESKKQGGLFSSLFGGKQ